MVLRISFRRGGRNDTLGIDRCSSAILSTHDLERYLLDIDEQYINELVTRNLEQHTDGSRPVYIKMKKANYHHHRLDKRKKKKRKKE